MKIVITGGHHTSALPVIKKFQVDNDIKQIVWIGHKYSQKGNKNPTLEYKQITQLGLKFYDLKAGKFYKTYNIKRLFKIPLGFFQALFILVRERPNAILSFGGYLAVPVVLAGWLLGIPCVTHEQTVVAGYANKLISKFANKVLISWEDSKKYFPKEKTQLSGLPIREELFNYSSDEFKLNSELNTIYITAGKTGSHKINMQILEILPELLEKFNIIHQCGDHSSLNDFQNLHDKLKQIPEPQLKGKYFLKKYLSDHQVGEAYNKADFIICRSGAHTISELIVLEKPAILIPIPWVSHNEQFKNASIVENAGLGIILDENELNPQFLLEKVNEFSINLDTYKLTDPNIKDHLLLDSSTIIYQSIKEIL